MSFDLRAFLEREIRDIASAAARPQAINPKPDEGKLIARASEGSAARGFLESPIVQAFFAQAEANIITAMADLPLEADAGRRDLATSLKAMRKLRQYLVTLTQDGRAAERELERLASGRREFF